MNTELTSLLSDFKNQLNIPEHEQLALRGFFNFLINRDAMPDEELIPYGMLVQYDEEESLEIFKSVLMEIPDKLKTKEPYRIFTVKEDKYYTLPIVPDRRDILVITDCNEDDSLELIMQRFENTPEVVKIICAPSSVVENRFKKDDHFFYRILPRHVHLEKLRSSEITGQFLNYMNTKGYTVSQDFIDEIGYYIESIYDTADFRNRDFVLDLMRRIELQMEENEGILKYRNGLIVDASFIPYSRKVNLRRKKEKEDLEIIQKKDKNEIQTDETQSVPEDKSSFESKQTPISNECSETPAEPNENETHVQTHRPSDKIYNVLLLALSTINGTIRKTEFAYDSTFGTIQVTGRYQLDPVPIMLDELLAKKDKNNQTRGTLDKIIMLCTQKTRKKIEKVFSPEGVHYNISPEEYFKRQVRNFMRPDTPDEDLFTVIEVEPASPYQGIQSVINVLRNIKKEHERQTLDLYLDTHGGIRGIQRIMEATVSLLKSEDIRVRDAFAVEFAPKPEKDALPEPSRIISETENMKIYDFVSGVNEFFSCGRADTLMKYKEDLETANKQKSNSKNVFSQEEEKLVKAIHDVAEGIQWCSIPAFDQGISDLQTIFPEKDVSEASVESTLAENSSTENIEKGSYLDIYRTNIQKDYSTLLKKDHTVLDEIEWCINKGFYQQALTLIESRISGLLVFDLKLFTFNPPQNIKPDNKIGHYFYSYTYTNRSQNIPSKKDKKFSINDVFNAYIFEFKRPNGKIWITDTAFNNLTEENYKNFRSAVSYPAGNDIMSVFTKASAKLVPQNHGAFDDENKKKINWNNCFKLNADSGRLNYLFNIMVLHQTLKRVRNTMNHAADDSPFNISAIDLALKNYIKWIKCLLPKRPK